MPREGVELILVVSQAAEVGCPERFQVRQPKGNHAFLVEYFEWMADWFRLASSDLLCVGLDLNFYFVPEYGAEAFPAIDSVIGAEDGKIRF